MAILKYVAVKSVNFIRPACSMTRMYYILKAIANNIEPFCEICTIGSV